VAAAHAWDAKAPEKEAQVLATAQAAATRSRRRCAAADDCGAGCTADPASCAISIAEKLMRDAKQLALCCATAEQLDQLAAAVELGAPLDPALVLPTPETQADLHLSEDPGELT
jgi:hypothetical protein